MWEMLFSDEDPEFQRSLDAAAVLSGAGLAASYSSSMAAAMSEQHRPHGFALPQCVMASDRQRLAVALAAWRALFVGRRGSRLAIEHARKRRAVKRWTSAAHAALRDRRQREQADAMAAASLGRAALAVWRGQLRSNSDRSSLLESIRLRQDGRLLASSFGGWLQRCRELTLLRDAMQTAEERHRRHALTKSLARLHGTAKL